MLLHLALCYPADAATIVSLKFPDNDRSLQLQFRKTSPADIRADYEGRHTSLITTAQAGNTQEVYLKALNDRNEMTAFAEWALTATDGLTHQCPHCISKPLAGLETRFVERMSRAKGKMHQRVLKERGPAAVNTSHVQGASPYTNSMFLIPIELNDLATEPAHRRQGAGSIPVSWAF